MLLEIATNSVENALMSEEFGANRIELCDNLGEGGTTPSIGMVEQTVAALSIPVMVMIRPRSGDFLYSETELNVMLRDIEACRQAGAYGVVFGCLNSNGTINVDQTRKLVEAAGEIEVTFHRAFDMTENPLESLDTLIDLGVKRVLTSGQQPSAMEGAGILSQLVAYAQDRITIMPGAGINPDNVAQLVSMTGAKEVHCSALKRVPGNMQFQQPTVSMGAKSASEFELEVCDTHKITGILAALQNL